MRAVLVREIYLLAQRSPLPSFFGLCEKDSLALGFAVLLDHSGIRLLRTDALF